ncbi:hypothetical protein PRK78_006983 [Emydomyces testavorans]|uniref:GAR domain-containing protein n=1 Tax=Emydomyces testavorans TaxID=2070801 RepID=A0AAF0DNJ6_9EURO|nr:hypothetical protein PRK78_006983 [Emydomyces testavorans]
MAEHPFKPLTPALRLAPSTPRTRSPSPRRPRSPERRNQFLALELDPLLSNLSPQSTLRALSAAEAVPSDENTPSDALKKSIANVSTLERAFGIRAALAAQILREWYAEILSWSWASKHEAGLGKGFVPPSTFSTGGLATNEFQHCYFGSLPARVVEQYENRVDEIRDDMDALDVEELKEHVLNVHIPSRSRPISSYSTVSIEVKPLSYVQLSDFTAVVTATILQALPVLSKLNNLLATWDVRLIVLRQIPNLLQGLKEVRSAIDTALARLKLGMLPELDDELFSKESFATARRKLEREILALGGQMDRILDELEGRPDSLPESWIDDMEAIETDFAIWASQAQEMAIENDWKRSLEARELTTPKPTKITQVGDNISDLCPKILQSLEMPVSADKHGIPGKSVPGGTGPTVAQPPSASIPATDREWPILTESKNKRYGSVSPVGATDTNSLSDAKSDEMANLNQPDTLCSSSLLSLENQPASRPGEQPSLQPATASSKYSGTDDEHRLQALSMDNQTHDTIDSSKSFSQSIRSSTPARINDLQISENFGSPPVVDSSTSTERIKIDDNQCRDPSSDLGFISEQETKINDQRSIRRNQSLPLEQYIDNRVLLASNDMDVCSTCSVSEAERPSTSSTEAHLRSKQVSKDFTEDSSSSDLAKAKPMNGEHLESFCHFSENRSCCDDASDDTCSVSSLPGFSSSPQDSVSSDRETPSPPSPTLLTPPDSSNLITPSNSYNAPIPTTAVKLTSHPPYMISDKSPEDHLEKKISSILTTIPARIHLSSTPVNNSNETSAENHPQVVQRPNREESSSTRPTTPTPTLTLTPAYNRPKRRQLREGDNPVRLYHLHRGGKQPPLKLFVRLVGEEGERVMVRVGGGWADLAEYLREYVMHHGRRRMLSENKLEVQEIPNTSPPYRLSPPHRSPGRLVNGRTTPISRPGSAFDIRPTSPLVIRKTRPSNASGAVRPTLTVANLEKASEAADPGSFPLTRRRLSISSTTSMFSSTPLGLAGPTPKSRNVSMSPESEAWVEDMMGQARKTSATLRSKLSIGSLRNCRPSPMAENVPQFKGRLEANARRVSDFARPPSDSGGSSNKRVFLKGLNKAKA